MHPIHNQPTKNVSRFQVSLMVQLADGTEHRSGRTYADCLENWLDHGES